MKITVREAINNNIWEEVRELYGIDVYAIRNGMSDQRELEISMQNLKEWGVF